MTPKREAVVYFDFSGTGPDVWPKDPSKIPSRIRRSRAKTSYKEGKPHYTHYPKV